MNGSGRRARLATRRVWVAMLGALLALSLLSGGARAGERGTGLTAVVELFTSQGCSSCPPADALLSAYAERPDTLALAWHVDYWNYLGWRDTFSRAAFSERQRGYAQRMEGGVFTPQAVVNGSAQAIGSRSAELGRLTRDARSMPLLPLSVRREGARVRVALSGTPAERAAAEGAALLLVRYALSTDVVIDRGENRGRTVTYRNVVRSVQVVGHVRDGALHADLSIVMVPGEGCALVLQDARDDAPGPILAAARIE